MSTGNDIGKAHRQNDHLGGVEGDVEQVAHRKKRALGSKNAKEDDNQQLQRNDES